MAKMVAPDGFVLGVDKVRVELRGRQLPALQPHACIRLHAGAAQRCSASACAAIFTHCTLSCAAAQLEPALLPAGAAARGAALQSLSACHAIIISYAMSLLLLQVPELVVRSRASLQAANPELLAAQGGHELLRITHGNALSGALLLGYLCIENMKELTLSTSRFACCCSSCAATRCKLGSRLLAKQLSPGAPE